MHAGKSGESTPAATKGRRRLGHRLTLWSVLESVSKMTTPSAPFRWLRVFFLMAQPPLLFQERNTLALTWFIVVFLAPAAAAQAPITNPVAGDRDAIRAGSGVYAMRCASCHGMDAKGTPAGSDLSALWTAGGKDQTLFQSIRRGFPNTLKPHSFGPDKDIWAIL